MGEPKSCVRALEKFNSLVEMFFIRADSRGDQPFLFAKRDKQWQPISWREAARQVAALASALRGLGLQPGDRVMLVSENRPEWCIADLAIMAAGGVTVPTYTTNTTRDHAHILSDSGARFVIFSTQRIAANLLPAVLAAPAIETVISMEPVKFGQGAFHHHHWADLLNRPVSDEEIATLRDQPVAGRNDLACIIYTSGTGGVPRGVMQHHGAILHNVSGCIDIIEADFEQDDPETFLSFLPLSHAYEHTAGQFLPIGLGAEIYFSEGLEKLAANIEETRPTIMVVVPRLFEVLRQRMLKTIEKQGGLGVRLLAAAERLGRKSQEKGGLGLFDKPLDFLVERTLRRKVKARLGGRLKAMVAGGAPLNPDVGLFFHSLGITLLQGYGQTEAAPVISCNRPAARIKMNTVGPPLKDTDVRIAEDGEILVAGELVMAGYWRNPEETAKALQGGWLHTGDIGMIDEDGHIVITDRKKDIIVNDKGDNIAPQRVEGILTLQPEIGQAMVYGDRRPHLVGVVVPDTEFMMEWAAEHGIEPAACKDNSEFVRAIQAAVDRVNSELQTVEKVRRIILADEPFTVENEQMTPSLKIRRHVLKKLYGQRLDALFR